MTAACYPGNRLQEQNPAYGLLQPLFSFRVSGVHVTDQELWSEASGQVRSEYLDLPMPVKKRLCELSSEIGALKDRHQKLVSRYSPDRLCEQCNGICCRYGKHHFTAVELIGYLAAERKLFTPCFDHPVCPYIGDSGCMMEPALRPFNCIIFICEALDNRLDESSRAELSAIEAKLRQLYLQIDQLLGNRFGNGLLISFQRSVDAGAPMFKC